MGGGCGGDSGEQEDATRESKKLTLCTVTLY